MSAVTRTVSIIALSTMVAAPCMAQSDGGFRRMTQLDGRFTPTGDMTAPRGSYHTATRLHDGKVLMAGCTGTTSAELYDPRSHTFTPTGSMTAVRCWHSATLLADGRVLIAGGYRQPGENLRSAEVYDPSTGTFTPTGDMIGLQFGHTATLLLNGRVLIAGGLAWGCLGCPGQVNNPELYDPSTGTFSLTGAFAGNGNADVIGGPAVSAAVALPDGRVLIAGEPTSELYDTLTGTFKLTGVMTTSPGCGFIFARAATLLTNGLVLLTGGENGDCGLFADAELYDVVTGRFTAIGSMTRRRTHHSATLLPDGTVLIAGGVSFYCDVQRCTPTIDASTEVFDPSAGSFTPTAMMSAGREGHSSTVLNDGTVLVAGGHFADSVSAPCCFANHRDLASAELWAVPALSTPVLLRPAP
jgi:galactose oxidase-like protein